MHMLPVAALIIAVCSVIGLIFDYRDDGCWFLGLLCAACLLQGIFEAWQEHHARAVGCLVAAAFVAGGCALALIKGRTRGR